MGERGPVGKRSEERIRRNTESEGGLTTQKFSMDDEVVVPRGVKFTDPEVQGIWDALQISVNRKFYEPTDWAYAKFVLTQWDKALMNGKLPGAMMMSALDGMLKRLLLTEDERRRVRIEAQRGAQVDDGAKVSDFYRDKFNERFGQTA